MIVSWNWLSDYVSLDCSVEEAADRLMMSGLNLEGLETVGDDYAIDLEVTSNRPDCLGHIGVARELCVLYDKTLSTPEAAITAVTDKTESVTSVENRVPEHCPQYMARVVRGVQIGPSPEWLVARLEAVGLRSVNNVVDVTNYVLLECGQPLHAFDLNRLDGKKIIVRLAEAGEKIVAIDGKEYELDDQTCVIADASRPVAVAGVMGGKETEVGDSTTDLLIETANFAPLSVRRTARKLSLFSDSSFRFERSIDIQQLDWANRRCCELITQLAGGEILDEPILVGKIPAHSPEPISIRYEQNRRLLGIDITPEETRKILSELGLQEQSANETEATFTPPSWRADLTREVDLIEEVARIHGYDRISENDPPKIRAAIKSKQDRTAEIVHQAFNAAGFYESITMSFVSEQQAQLFNPRQIETPLRVEHSSRKLENLLRPSLVPSLLVSRRANERTGTANAQLYEIARTFLGMNENGAEQILTVGCVTGNDLLHLKGVLEELVKQVNRDAVLTASSCDVPGFAAGRGAELQLNEQRWGWLGELDRSVTDQLDLRDAVTVAEFELTPLVELLDLEPQYRTLPQFPASERDFNFLLDEGTTWQQLEQAIREAGGELLEEVLFAGQYRGKQIGAGKKTYLARVLFRSSERTLAGEEVEALHAKIVANCESKLSAVLR